MNLFKELGLENIYVSNCNCKLPENVTKVAISNESEMMQDIFHDKVETILIFDGYKHFIKKEVFPKSLKKLIISNVEIELTKDSIPDHINILAFNKYSFEITKEIVKESISILFVCGYTKFQLDKSKLPKNTIKFLFFQDGYNHIINESSIVDNLTRLVLKDTIMPVNLFGFKDPSYFPKTVEFSSGYKFKIQCHQFPNYPRYSVRGLLNILIGDVVEPITNKLFNGLGIIYKVKFGFGYKYEFENDLFNEPLPKDRHLLFSYMVNPIKDNFIQSNFISFYKYPFQIYNSIFRSQSITEFEVFELKYPLTKESMPTESIGTLLIHDSYRYELTSDILENVNKLILFDPELPIFTNNSISKSNLKLQEVNLIGYKHPFNSSYFSNISKLRLGKINQILSKDSFPPTLKSLIITDNKISSLIDILPESLTSLSIDESLVQLIEGSIPKNITNLSFIKYSHQIKIGLIPNTLKNLSLGDLLFQIPFECFPNDLESLKIGVKYNTRSYGFPDRTYEPHFKLKFPNVKIQCNCQLF